MKGSIRPDLRVNSSELLDVLQAQIIVVNGAIYRQPIQAEEMTSRPREYSPNLLDIDALGSIELRSDGEQMRWLEWGPR